MYIFIPTQLYLSFIFQIVQDIDISGTWNAGRGAVETMVSFDFVEEINNQVTLLHPISPHKHVGVDLTDFESDEPGITALVGTGAAYVQPTVVQPTEALATETPVPDTVSGADTLVDRLSVSKDCQVDVQGKAVYKATILKELFSNDNVSSDRLRRVQGLSQYPAEEMIALEDSVMPGIQFAQKNI